MLGIAKQLLLPKESFSSKLKDQKEIPAPG